MDTGLFFYWVGWLLLILLTFFNLNLYNRHISMYWLFSLMICMPLYITVLNYELSVAFIVLLVGAIVLYSQLTMTIKMIFMTFTVMMCYISLRIWEVISPVWYFMPTYILIPLVMSAIVFLLFEDSKEQIAHTLLAMSCGELLYSFILNSYSLHIELVSALFFDCLAITLLIICLSHILKFLSHLVKEKLTILLRNVI